MKVKSKLLLSVFKKNRFEFDMIIGVYVYLIWLMKW